MVNPFPTYDSRRLMLWREGRNEFQIGMHGILNVVQHRVTKNKSSYDDEIYKPRQFTSMSVTSDSQYSKFPNSKDAADWNQWLVAGILVDSLVANTLDDLVERATVYYNPKGIETTKRITINGVSISFPETWNPLKLDFAVRLGKHYFFRELTHAKLA